MQTTYDNTTIGVDLAKSVFHCTELNRNMKIVRQYRLKRSQMLDFFGGLDASRIRCVTMEACGGAHYWGRRLQGLGLTVQLLHPKFAKTYTINNKTDANDSVGIAEASRRPRMHPVAVKSVAQQDLSTLLRNRDQAVKSRTMWCNSIRAHLSERGLVTGQSRTRLHELIHRVVGGELSEFERTDISDDFISMLDFEFRHGCEIDLRVRFYDACIMAAGERIEEVQRLQTIPGIGPLTATSIVAAVGDGSQFKDGRDMSAWLGLVPRQHSSGGQQRSGGITKTGDTQIRTLLNHGARSVIRSALGNDGIKDPLYRKARKLHPRIGHNKTTSAIANTLARICWSVLTTGQDYNPGIGASADGFDKK